MQNFHEIEKAKKCEKFYKKNNTKISQKKIMQKFPPKKLCESFPKNAVIGPLKDSFL